MTPVWRAKTIIGFAALVAVTCVIGGCGGGGGGDGGGFSSNGVLLAVSFVGFVTQPSGQGPNGAVPLPEVFIDQTLEFQFDAPIDDGILGGFFTDATGAPMEFLGVSASATTGGIPYYAYVNQSVAANSLQIRQNAMNGPVLASYIIGRHRDKPDTIVVDPRVPGLNPLGLPFSTGFAINTEFTYRIPSNTQIFMGGGTRAAQVGVDPLLLPIVLNSFGPLPVLSPVFRAGSSTGPDPVPPEVLSIEAIGPSGQPVAGTASDPMPAQGSFLRVTFTKAIDPASIDLLNNFIIRNQDLVTVQEPNGRLVPGNLTINPATPQVAVFTPIPTWGPGVNMTTGYAIEVRVGTFGDPSLPQIAGLPQGNPPQQLDLSNSLSRVLVTEPCATCEGSVAVIESFASSGQVDLTFNAGFDDCRWNDTSLPGALAGTAISGTPLATFTGTPQNLGTRMQVNMPIGTGTTLPLTTVPFPGLFSPFDDNGANNLGAGINPNGGSHSMWLIEAANLGSPVGSLELIEWGPVNNTVVQTIYPQYQVWCGMTSVTAPINCPNGVTGMSTIYAQNYNIAPPQTADPMNLNPTGMPPGAGGVLVTPPQGYNAGPGFTSYFPFPVFTPPFDYIGTGAGSGNLLYEINIETGMQISNFNRYRATNFVPVRRIIGAPLSTGFVTSSGSGCDVYDSRFTFVSIVSQCRSLFYDTGVTTGTPIYSGINLSPDPTNQPMGTAAIWNFEGATAISSPSTPMGPTSGFLTYWTGSPLNGTFDPLVLQDPMNMTAPQLTGNRYFRFDLELRNDNITNATQQYNSLIAAIVVSGT